MKLFRLLGLGALLALAGTGISSCLSPPDYPIEPNIDFKDIKLVRVPNADGGNIELDTVIVSLNFRDGDGDLGLDDADIKVPPFNTTTGGHNNLGYRNNFFVQPFKKVGGVNGSFVKFVTPLLPQGKYDGRYPRLDGSVDGKRAPLKGSMTYKLPVLTLDRSNFNVGDVFRFEVSILDRGLHESNVIITAEVILGR